MNFRDTLRRLFTRNVIVTKIPGGRLRTFDVNKTQSDGAATAFNYRNKWRNGRNFGTMSGYGSGFTNYEVEAMRKQMYIDYELMDSDAIIASALDVYSDESTTSSVEGELLVIKTDDEEVRKILHNLFYDVLNIEFNLWSWVRSACKYGDYFLYLQIVEKHGVVNVIPIHPSLLVREEGTNEDPNKVIFRYEGDGGFIGTNNIFEQFEIAHFRLITDSNYLPYGRSIIEPARKEYKKLSLAEDALLLNRITRAPERRLFKIDVGNIAPEEIDAYIEQISSEMKKVPYIDPQTGDFNLRYSLESSLDDYFMPVRGGDSGTSIETLPGLTNEGQIQDVEYIKDKMLAALKIPKAFIGFGEGGDGKANLSSIDIRFARTVERVQKIIVSELYKIAFVHLYSQGYKSDDLLNFELELTSPSLIYERQKIDMMNEKINLIANIKEHNIFSNKYIYEVIFGLSESEWKADQDRVDEDLKLAFRREQIKAEGNDPKVSGKTFGTPHDIASMQVASKFNVFNADDTKHLYSQDEREFNEGQPEKFGSFETKRDEDMGRDPVGKKQLDAKIKAPMESFDRMKAGLDKFLTTKRKILSETMLNEDNILTNEI